MNFRKIGIILFLIFSLFPVSKIFAQTTNAGFVPGNIWYSKDPFTEGDTIKIYTLIFNPDTRKFSGTVDFYDKSVLLGTKDFSVAGTSTKDISINWTVTAGDHQIFGQIKNAKFLVSTGKYENVSLTDSKTTTSARTVSAKVISQSIANSVNTVDTAFNTALDSIQNIGNTAKDTLPTSVTDSATTAGNSVENIRQNISNTLETEKNKTQNQIDALNKTGTSTKNTTNSNIIEKPFDYVKLFFLTILGWILKYPLVFYGSLVIIVLLFLRYLWHLIF